jgi:2Fe-2S ferredoxin
MPKITLLRNGKTYEVPMGTTFLDFCLDHEAPHDFGCTHGSCGTCVLVLEQGAQNVNPLTSEEQETLDMCTTHAGARLGCQLSVLGDITVRQLE